MNAEFELSLENHNDIFSISPKKGSKSITASIFVTDSKDIDYDLGDTEYVIHVSIVCLWYRCMCYHTIMSRIYTWHVVP